MQKLKILFIVIFIICAAQNSYAKRLHRESYYQELNCTGETEFRLPDATRVDCLTEEYATEFDFANKWAEAIGQALHYGRMTGKKPAIALIMEKESDEKYYQRIIDNIVFYNLPITVWIIK